MNIFIRLFYAILIRPWLRYIIGVKFENQECFDKISQCIIVANHNSHFDTVSIMAALPNKMMKTTRAIAAGDYFGKTYLRGLATRLFFNATLITRGSKTNGQSTIELLDNEIKDGRSLVLFPEGTRGKPGIMADFKKGIAILLKENPHIPFVPVYLDGFGRVLPKGKIFLIPLICKVRFGDPLYPKNNNVETILEEVKEAILNLKDKDERSRNTFEIK